MIHDEMYDLEVFVGEPEPPPNSKESQRVAWIVYKEERIWINLTRMWERGCRDYGMFLDELIGAIIHEFLHYFMQVNKMHQTEEAIRQITPLLHILSLGHLIGAGEEETEEDKAYYQEWINNHFKKKL